MYNAEVIVYFSKEGIPKPYRIRFYENGEPVVLNIQRVIQKDILLVNKNKYYEFRCEASVDDRIKQFRVKYSFDSCRWHIV